jgi:hypothetical protein
MAATRPAIKAHSPLTHVVTRKRQRMQPQVDVQTKRATGGSVVALRLWDEHRLLALGALEHLRLKDGHHEGHGALAAIASGCRRLGRARVRLFRAHDALRVWDRTHGCVALPRAARRPAVPALAGYGTHPAAALPRSLADLEFT